MDGDNQFEGAVEYGGAMDEDGQGVPEGHEMEGSPGDEMGEHQQIYEGQEMTEEEMIQ